MLVGVGTQRTFLFLQGLSTPFFVRLAGAIAARGHRVERINLSGGDRVFWPRLGAVDYRGKFADWELGIITRDVIWGEGRFPDVHLDPSNYSARKGDYVLVEPFGPLGSLGFYGRTAWLPNSAVGNGRGVSTSLQSGQVEVVR